MKMQYLKNGETLSFSAELCTGCRMCVEVCPHAVFMMSGGTAAIVDRGSCMECGACMRNCEAGAIRVKAGVGCATAVLKGILQGTEPTCGCNGSGAASCQSTEEPAGEKTGCC